MAEPCGVAQKDSAGKLAEGGYAAIEKIQLVLQIHFIIFFP